MLPKVVIGCMGNIHGYNYKSGTLKCTQITFSGFVQIIGYDIGLTTYLTKFDTSIGTLFCSVRHPLTKIKQNYVSWEYNFSKHLYLYRTLSIVSPSSCLQYSLVIMVGISYCQYGKQSFTEAEHLLLLLLQICLVPKICQLRLN